MIQIFDLPTEILEQSILSQLLLRQRILCVFDPTAVPFAVQEFIWHKTSYFDISHGHFILFSIVSSESFRNQGLKSLYRFFFFCSLSLACRELSRSTLPWLGLRHIELLGTESSHASPSSCPMSFGTRFLSRVATFLHSISFVIPDFSGDTTTFSNEMNSNLLVLAAHPSCPLKEISITHGPCGLGGLQPFGSWEWFAQILSRFQKLEAIGLPCDSPIWKLLNNTQPLQRYFYTGADNHVSHVLSNLQTYGEMHLLGIASFRLCGLQTPQLMKNFSLSHMWYRNTKKIMIGSTQITTSTLLHFACAQAHNLSVELIDTLIRHSNIASNIDSVRLYGKESGNLTLLHVAIGSNHPGLVEHLLKNYDPSLSLRALDSIFQTGFNAVELSVCLQLPDILEILFKYRASVIADQFDSAPAVYRLFYLAQKEFTTLRGDNNLWSFPQDAKRTARVEPGAVLKVLDMLWTRFSSNFSILDLRDEMNQCSLMHYAESGEAIGFWLSKKADKTIRSFQSQTPLEMICRRFCMSQCDQNAVLSLLEKDNRIPAPSTQEIRALIAAFATMRMRRSMPTSDVWSTFEQSIWRCASRKDLEAIFTYSTYGYISSSNICSFFMSYTFMPLLRILSEKQFRFAAKPETHSYLLLSTLERVMRPDAVPETRISDCFFLQIAAESHAFVNPKKPLPRLGSGLFNHDALSRLCKLLFDGRLTSEEQRAVAKSVVAVTDYCVAVRHHQYIRIACINMNPHTKDMPDFSKQAHAKIVNANLQIEDTADFDPEDFERLFLL